MDRLGNDMAGWVLHERQGRLSRGDDVKVLTPRAAQVLAALARRRGETVSRDEIIADAWRGLHVSPDLVRLYVHDIRKAVGDEAAGAAFIETVRGRGFRLVSDVSLAMDDVAHDRRPVVAVLRPTYFGEGERWRFLADSLAEDLTTDLARFADISVAARNSAFAVDVERPAAEIASVLRANYLVEGSFAVLGDTVRTTFQLIEAEGERHVWAERTDHSLDGLTAISGNVATRVANAIGGWSGMVHHNERRRALRGEPSSWSAYEHYLMSLHYEHIFDRPSILAGIEHGEKAVSLDPGLARCWLVLKFLYSQRAQSLGIEPERSNALASEAIERAYAIDPYDSKIVVEMGFARAQAGDLTEAELLLHRAADLGYGQADTLAILANAFCTILGEFEEARHLLDRAYELNPFAPNWYNFPQARVSFYTGDYERCMAAARSAQHVLAGALYGALAAVKAGAPDGPARARHLEETFPHFNPEAHARSFPIVAPKAVALYWDGVRQLDQASAPTQ